MQLQKEIEAIFEGKAFLRPLFYSYPGGLRFELSEGGSAIEEHNGVSSKEHNGVSSNIPTNYAIFQ
jgi:hypothetical protein